MKTLKAEELLQVWEHGLNQPLLQRGLLLLAAANPKWSPDTLLMLSIGQRDSQLFLLRERLFGKELQNSAVCPHCDARIEWQNQTTDLLVDRTEHPTEGTPKNFEVQFSLDDDIYQVQFRLPNNHDLSSALHTTNSQMDLLSRCIFAIEKNDHNLPQHQWSEAVLEKIESEMQRLDPQADIGIHLNCPECAHQWRVTFDINSFLWTELSHWAEQLLVTIYKLAAAYGWSEREILQLSPMRRQFYLGALGQ